MIGYGVALLAAWALVAFAVGRPTDYHEYHKTAVESAQAALSAARTAAVAGRAAVDGRLLDPYLSTVLDNAIGSIASAQQQLAAADPPGAAGRRLRDELVPLLVTAGDRTGDLSRARSAGARTAAVEGLLQTGDRLADFVDRHA
jgi:hypothetical protein